MSEPERPDLLDAPPAPRSNRPSLVGVAAVSSAESGQGISILSALEPPPAQPTGAAPRLLAQGLPWIGLAMLLLIAVAFWLEWQREPPSSPTIVATPSPAAPPPAVSAPIQAAAVASATAEGDATQPPASEAATIELIPERSPETAQAPQSTQPSIAALLAHTPAKSPEPKPRAEARPGIATSTIAPSTTAKNARKQQSSPFASIQGPVPAMPKRVVPASGTDVDLLAALLTHGGTQATSAGGSQSSKPSARPKLSTRLSSLTPQPSTRERLSQCKLLSAQDSARCKARVCAGLWGLDAGCPAGSEPPQRAGAG